MKIWIIFKHAFKWKFLSLLVTKGQNHNITLLDVIVFPAIMFTGSTNPQNSELHYKFFYLPWSLMRSETENKN